MEAAAVNRSSRIFSTDHRVIARQYFFLSLFAVVIGVCLSMLMRFHLIWPQAHVSWFEKIWSVRTEGGVMTEELYLSLMTLHGTIMVFFVLTLAPLNTYLALPEQLGCREMAFPRLNMLSFWIAIVSFLTLLASCIFDEGGPIAGWTAYPPLSAVGAISGPGEGLGQTLWFFSIAIFSLASLLSAMNIVSTVIECRRPGMSLMQMPLTCWNWFVTAILKRPFVPRAARSGHSDTARPPRGDQLLRARRSSRRGKTSRTFRRHSPALAASVLVLRASGGLHRDPAGHGNRVPYHFEFFAATAVFLPGMRVGADRHCVPRDADLGPPHVHRRHQPL